MAVLELERQRERIKQEAVREAEDNSEARLIRLENDNRTMKIRLNELITRLAILQGLDLSFLKIPDEEE